MGQPGSRGTEQVAPAFPVRAARALVAGLLFVGALGALAALASTAAASPLELGAAGVGCAGDGPPTKRVLPSALLSGALVPLAGRDVDPRFGDPIAGDGLVLRTLRLGVCGALPVRGTTLYYNLGYEPWDELERARADARAWGRVTAAEIGWAPWRWLTVSAGIHKVAFAYGHDEPEGALALPIRPGIVADVAPDRRLGLAVDAALGAARFSFGVYESARDLGDLGDRSASGVLVTGRASVQPFGPLGLSPSTRDDPPAFRNRPRIGLGASGFYEYTPERSSFAVGGDLPFKWGPFGLVVEYLYDSGSLVERASTRRGLRPPRQGAWAQASLMLFHPHLELEARWEWHDEPMVALERYHAFTGGLTVYELGGVVRAQLVYINKLHARLAIDDQAALFVITLQR